MDVVHSIFLLLQMMVKKRLIRFADEVRLRGVAGTLEDRITNQNDLDILKSCSDKIKINMCSA